MRRRRFLAGAAALAGASALEAASLGGKFDHHRIPGGITPAAQERYKLSLRLLEGRGAEADGAIVHVGHSTHLLCVAGARMLTDPWFYDPAFGALSHLKGPAVAPESVGELDAILVSHDHADHIDPRAADRLDKKATMVVATAEIAARMRAMGFGSVVVLAPWESIEIRRTRVTAVPGVHDIYEIGFVVEGAGRRVYFAGDTRLHDDLPAIAERFAPTIAILPVDGTRLTRGAMHVMTPDDAVQATKTLKVRAVMPSHAEAKFTDLLAKYALASTIDGAPALFAAAMERALPNVVCHLPEPGQMILLPAPSA